MVQCTQHYRLSDVNGNVKPAGSRSRLNFWYHGPYINPIPLFFRVFPILLRLDLHCHSTRSDGLLTPRELVMRAAERGVQGLALTDHDVLDGLDEARRAAADAGVEFVCGVEISVTWHCHTLHVVGLHIDPRNEGLAEGLMHIRNGRLNRAEKIAAALASAGIDGSFQGALAHVTNPGLIGRTHFARYLVGAGHARTVQSAFEQYLTSGRPGYVPHQWAGLQQAITWIRASGGIAVLAHPGRYRLGAGQRESLLRDFAELGGGAMEVVTGSDTREQHHFWGSCARRYGLFASVGSDFHGPREDGRDFGALGELPGGCRPVWRAW